MRIASERRSIAKNIGFPCAFITSNAKYSKMTPIKKIIVPPKNTVAMISEDHPLARFELSPTR